MTKIDWDAIAEAEIESTRFRRETGTESAEFVVDSEDDLTRGGGVKKGEYVDEPAPSTDEELAEHAAKIASWMEKYG